MPLTLTPLPESLLPSTCSVDSLPTSLGHSDETTWEVTARCRPCPVSV